MNTRYLRDVLSGIAKYGRSAFERRAPDSVHKRLLYDCHDLLRVKGEASAVYVAGAILDDYATLSEAHKLEFFEGLLADFLPETDEIRRAIDAYEAVQGPVEIANLTNALESPRQELIRALMLAPDGMISVIGMRADLLRVMKAHGQLAPLDNDFVRLFKSCFDRAFLQLDAINWRSPAHVLEKLIAYESVHAIRGWSDLRRRLAADRRCFAFFHPALPDEPVIFVELALCRGMLGRIADVIEAEPIGDAQSLEPDTAIFYSINNCHVGLKSIQFGNFLIKHVTDELAGEFPDIKTFATLSPIPGFANWLRSKADCLKLSPKQSDIHDLVTDLAQGNTTVLDNASAPQKNALQSLCATYLVNEKRGDGTPANAVARFHLRNGAHIERINWLGDSSKNGIHHSFGLLVNYVYDRKKVAANHETFMNDGTVAVSGSVKRLASQGGGFKGWA